MSSKYPTYELQPRKLNEAETANPYLVIQNLFSYGHLPELRELLWHWFTTTVKGCYHKNLNRNERYDVVNIYEHIERLLEAVHLIHVNRGGMGKSATGNDATPPTGATAEENMLQLIKLTVQPESIFRFTPAGMQGPVHLLIVLPNKTQAFFKQAQALLGMACINNRQYMGTVIMSAELQQKLCEGHLYYAAVCTYANRVHHNHAPALPLLAPATIQQIKTKTRQQLTQAINRAAGFSVGAHSYIQKNDLPIAAFMLQQAAEQLLRAAIMILMQQEIKTHAINTLLKYTACCAPQLNDTFALPQNQTLIPLLDKAYIDARYGNLIISTAEANALQLLVASLLQQTEDYLNNMIECFGKPVEDVE